MSYDDEKMESGNSNHRLPDLIPGLNWMQGQEYLECRTTRNIAGAYSD
jgi:hypothetical protein